MPKKKCTRQFVNGQDGTLASKRCQRCMGTGRLIPTGERCGCVDRGVFRACLRSYHEREITLEAVFCKGGQRGRKGYCLKNAEYRADFEHTARRTLDTDAELATFRMFFLHASNYRSCCKELRLNRTKFFKMLYRLETRLGEAMRQEELFPPHAY